MTAFEDTVAIESVLVTPTDYGDEMTKQIDELGGKLGLIDDAWQFFFHYSLLERVFTPISGDWGELKSMAEGWDNLAKAASGVGQNLAGFSSAVGQSWNGEAYDAFDNYIGKWETALSNEQQMSAEMAAFVRDIADNAKAAFEMIITTLNLVIDIILTAMRVASIPGYGQIKAIKKAREAAKAVAKIFSLIKGLFDLIDSFIEYAKAFKKCIEEGNDNHPAPSGVVAVPEVVK